MLKFLLWFNVIFKFLDVATTYYGVTIFTIEGEANPFVYFLMKQLGVIGSLITVYSIALISFIFLYYLVKESLRIGNLKKYKFGMFAFFTISIVHLWVVINNIYQIFIK